MSMGQEAIYELERERKRELYLKRIRENTALYYEKYLKIYNEYLSKGYQEILSEEMRNLKEDLDYIRNNLESNPESARDISFNIKSYIYALKKFYNDAIKKEAEIQKIRREKEKLQQEAIKNQNLQKINSAIKNIKNPIQREIAYKLFIQLKDDILNGKDINLDIEIEKIHQLSLKKTKDYQQSTKKEEIKIEIEKVKKAPKDILERIKKSIEQNNFQESEKLIEEAEKEILNEEIRKETVKAIYKTLKDKGFLVEKPKIIDGEVIIKAKKPSGNRVYCKVDLDGKFSYKFDQYKGNACKKDIEIFEKNLDKIYGIKIKNKKTTWQNPDMVYKDGIQIYEEDEKCV